MGHLARDPGDSADQARPGTYVSDRGWSYRLLASLDVPGAWRIYPEPDGDLSSPGPLRPGYLAVPQHDERHGYCYGFAVYRVGGAGGKPVGYGMNLADVCWPVEDDLIRIRHQIRRA